MESTPVELNKREAKFISRVDNLCNILNTIEKYEHLI